MQRFRTRFRWPSLFDPGLLFVNGEQGAWYDPSDFSTLFQDAAGTTPVTATGQPVGRILDKSGRGNHATQSTSTSRPTLEQDGTGRYYLSFDGVDDWLSVPSSTTAFRFLHNNLGATITVGTAVAGAAVFNAIVSSGNLGDASVTGWSFSKDDRTTGTVVNTMTNGSGTLFCNQVPSQSVSSNPRVYTVVNSSSTHIIRSNASVLSSSASEVGSPNSGDSTYNLTVGAAGAAGFSLNGRLYGLIIRGALSNTSQIEAAERYMNSKTGAF